MFNNNDIQTGNRYSFFIEPQEDMVPRQSVYAPPKKKKRRFAGIIALCLCFALIGGLVGGSVASLHYGQNQPTVQQGAQNSNPPAANAAQTALPGKELTASQVYEKGVVSCVSIRTTVTRDTFGRSFESTVSGSGFIISENGVIITNYHVIQGYGKNKISVTLYDGRTYSANVVGYDEDNDIAVLRISESNLTPVSLGSSNNLVVGAPI